MKTSVSILLLTMYMISSSLSQVSFSKEYDLDVGWSNHPGQFKQLEEELVVILSHICFEDTLPCTSIIKSNDFGEIISYQTIK